MKLKLLVRGEKASLVVVQETKLKEMDDKLCESI
jgi:hypothetical protein